MTDLNALDMARLTLEVAAANTAVVGTYVVTERQRAGFEVSGLAVRWAAATVVLSALNAVAAGVVGDIVTCLLAALMASIGLGVGLRAHRRRPSRRAS